jgi:hypothetical protein
MPTPKPREVAKTDPAIGRPSESTALPVIVARRVGVSAMSTPLSVCAAPTVSFCADAASAVPG